MKLDWSQFSRQTAASSRSAFKRFAADAAQMAVATSI